MTTKDTFEGTLEEKLLFLGELCREGDIDPDFYTHARSFEIDKAVLWRGADGEKYGTTQEDVAERRPNMASFPSFSDFEDFYQQMVMHQIGTTVDRFKHTLSRNELHQLNTEVPRFQKDMGEFQDKTIFPLLESPIDRTCMTTESGGLILKTDILLPGGKTLPTFTKTNQSGMSLEQAAAQGHLSKNYSADVVFTFPSVDRISSPEYTELDVGDMNEVQKKTLAINVLRKSARISLDVTDFQMNPQNYTALQSANFNPVIDTAEKEKLGLDKLTNDYFKKFVLRSYLSSQGISYVENDFRAGVYQAEESFLKNQGLVSELCDTYRTTVATQIMGLDHHVLHGDLKFDNVLIDHEKKLYPESKDQGLPYHTLLHDYLFRHGPIQFDSFNFLETLGISETSKEEVLKDVYKFYKEYSRRKGLDSGDITWQSFSEGYDLARVAKGFEKCSWLWSPVKETKDLADTFEEPISRLRKKAGLDSDDSVLGPEVIEAERKQKAAVDYVTGLFLEDAERDIELQNSNPTLKLEREVRLEKLRGTLTQMLKETPGASNDDGHHVTAPKKVDNVSTKLRNQYFTLSLNNSPPELAGLVRHYNTEILGDFFTEVNLPERLETSVGSSIATLGEMRRSLEEIANSGNGAVVEETPKLENYNFPITSKGITDWLHNAVSKVGAAVAGASALAIVGGLLNPEAATELLGSADNYQFMLDALPFASLWGGVSYLGHKYLKRRMTVPENSKGANFINPLSVLGTQAFLLSGLFIGVPHVTESFPDLNINNLFSSIGQLEEMEKNSDPEADKKKLESMVLEFVGSKTTEPNLKNYPRYFAKDGKFNGTVVVGDHLDARQTVLATEILANMYYNDSQGNVTERKKVGVHAYDILSRSSKLNVIEGKNILAINLPCSHSIMKKYYSNSGNCKEFTLHGEGRVDIFGNDGNNVAVVVSGHSWEDVKMAGKVLAYRSDEFDGEGVIVREGNQNQSIDSFDEKPFSHILTDDEENDFSDKIKDADVDTISLLRPYESDHHTTLRKRLEIIEGYDSHKKIGTLLESLLYQDTQGSKFDNPDLITAIFFNTADYQKFRLLKNSGINENEERLSPFTYLDKKGNIDREAHHEATKGIISLIHKLNKRIRSDYLSPLREVALKKSLTKEGFIDSLASFVYSNQEIQHAKNNAQKAGKSGSDYFEYKSFLPESPSKPGRVEYSRDDSRNFVEDVLAVYFDLRKHHLTIQNKKAQNKNEPLTDFKIFTPIAEYHGEGDDSNDYGQRNLALCGLAYEGKDYIFKLGNKNNVVHPGQKIKVELGNTENETIFSGKKFHVNIPGINVYRRMDPNGSFEIPLSAEPGEYPVTAVMQDDHQCDFTLTSAITVTNKVYQGSKNYGEEEKK